MANLELGNYPLPADAIAVYLGDDGQLRLIIPGERGDGHCITLPATPSAMPALVRLLKERQDAPVRPTIGMPGAPTSVMIAEYLAANPLPAKPEKLSTPELTPSELDALLSELEF